MPQVHTVGAVQMADDAPQSQNGWVWGNAFPFLLFFSFQVIFLV